MRERILNTVVGPGQVALFYIGQVGFIIKYKEKYILIDAYLSDFVDKRNQSPLWVRKYETPIRAEELDFVDFVFCSHAHCDHADPETLPVIAKVNSKAKFLVSASFTDLLKDFEISEDRIVGLHAYQDLELGEDIRVRPIPAAHEELHMDENEDYAELGFVFSFGDIKLFHSGDCCLYDGLEEAIAGCDILVLPINGRDYYRRYRNNIIGNFDCQETILLAQHVGAKLLIPTHFDLYEGNGLNPAYFVDSIYRINPKQAFHIFMPGEKYIYDAH